MPRTINPIRFVPTSIRTTHATMAFRMQNIVVWRFRASNNV